MDIIDLGGRASLGANLFGGIQTVNVTGAAAPSGQVGATLTLIRSSASTDPTLKLVSIAGGGSVNAYRVNGSVASPTAVLDTQQILQLQATGRASVANDATGNPAVIDIFANGDWTDSNYGTTLRVRLTPTGSVTLAEIFRADGIGITVAAGRVLKTTPVTVTTLPAAATAGSGSRAFVSDATVTTFASIVAGSGANPVPVYSDGTNWRIG